MSRKQSLPALETHIRKAWLAEKGLESEILDVNSYDNHMPENSVVHDLT